MAPKTRPPSTPGCGVIAAGHTTLWPLQMTGLLQPLAVYTTRADALAAE